jgi:hypothetical protein
MRRRAAPVAIAVIGVALLIASARGESETVGTAAAVRDFLIQNVCLDARGVVVSEGSPVDGNPACVAQRDLRAGERLPYHKHDYPDRGENRPLGYQRHDSFPVDTAGFGEVVEHSFDFGGFEGKRFGVFDSADGGDIAVLARGRVSFAATEDPSGFQLWVGECQGPVTVAALLRSWIIAEFDTDRAVPMAGETTARLAAAKAGAQETCPAHFNAAYTSWHVAPFQYRALLGQGTPITLTTLISDHYGGARRDNADHVERFYFTRELGGTRWERWQNANGNLHCNVSPAAVAEAAKTFVATGRCSEAPMPEGGAPMVLIDCREWTRIVPATDPAGDRPGFLIDALRSRPDMPAFFAPSGRPR